MHKVHYLLALLLIQCALIVWLYNDNFSSQTSATAGQSLLVLQADKLKSITITDDNKRSVLLEKTEQGWILPDYHQLQVDPGLLEQLLDKLTSLQAKWPVATTPGAAERFKVAAQHFKRSLRLTDNTGAVQELYLGDSPGPRKLYARHAEQTAVYSIEMGLHLVPTSERSWFDKRLLKIKGAMQQVTGADFVLVKQAENWQLKDRQETETINQPRLDGFINTLAYPQVQAVLGDEKLADLKDAKPQAHYEVQTQTGDVSYDIYRLGEDVILKSSQSELYFVVPVYATDSLLDIKRENLVIKAAQQEPSDSGEISSP